MTNDFILRAVKRAVPRMTLIVANIVDVDFYFDNQTDMKYAESWHSFVPGTVTWRACKLVFENLPPGEYDLTLSKYNPT